MPAQEIWGRRSSVCVYVYIHVCRCAHMSTYDICLPIALHITFCAHHFSLTGQWALASNCPSTHPPPHIQHCSYRCIHHTWLLHRCWSSDLKSSSYLLTKPSGQPSSPSLNSFGVSGYRHILSLSPDDLFFFHSGIVQMKNWYIFKQSQRPVAESHDLLEAWKAWGNLRASGQIQTTRSPLHPQWTETEKLKQLPNSEPWLKENLNLGDWGVGGRTTGRLNSSNWL